MKSLACKGPKFDGVLTFQGSLMDMFESLAVRDFQLFILQSGSIFRSMYFLLTSKVDLTVDGSLASLTLGCISGWPAPTLKKLREPNSPLHLTNYEEAWVVNAMYYGNILSPFPSGFLMNKLGRKNSLLILAVFAIISWILIYFSTSASMLMGARLLSGFWMGSTQTVASIYTAEISEPQVRGMIGTLYEVTNYLGNNILFVIGPYVPIQTMAIICGILPVLFFIMFSFCPESPYGYIVRNKAESAEKSLSWLRAGGPIQEEFEVIKTSVEREMKTKNTSIMNLLTNPANRKAFIIVQTVNAMNRLSGISCMKAFSSVILPSRVGSLTSDHCTIILGFVWMFSALICLAFVDKAGRKSLLYVSSWGISISMLWTGVWYFLNDKTTVDVSHLTWLPFLGFIVFGIVISIGLTPISRIYQGEMFPSNLKGQASALTTMIAAFSSTVSTWLFKILEDNVGLYMNFFVFAAVGFINLLFTYFYVIETKGKSLQMIQAELSGEKIEMSEINRDSESV